jgi:cytochrome b
VTFRLIWGVFGSKTSRFSDFLYGPQAIFRYLTRRDSFHRPGHNPLGGWMVMVLLCAIMAQGLLGLFGNDDILFDGPLSHLVDKSTSDLLTSLHKTLFLVLSGLVVIHVSAVLIHWLVLGDNLIRPMITGRKPGHGGEGVVFANSRRAVLALLCSAALVWGLLTLL